MVYWKGGGTEGAWKYVTLSVCALAAQELGNSAVAQVLDGPRADQPVQVGDSIRVFDAIVITAQRKEQTVQDTAASVAALGEDIIEDRGISRVEDLQFQIPGVTYSEIAGTPLIGIRGISLDIVTGAGEAAIATHIDGVYQARPTQTTISLGDLERVEVLRGPQGTLYGRNATGGAINFITRKPGLDREFGLVAGVGNFGLVTTSGFANVPLIDDTLMARVSFATQDRDGYLEEAVNAQEFNDIRAQGARAALRWSPNDRVTLDVSAFFGKDESDGPIYELFGTPNALTPAGTYTNTPYDTRVNPDNNDIWSKKKTTGFTTVAAFETDALVITSTTGVTRHELDQAYEGDASSVWLYNVGRIDRSDFVSQELSVRSAEPDRLDWIIGGYYSNEEYGGTLDVFFGPFAAPAIGQTQYQLERTNTFAVFGDASYSLAHRLQLIFGARGAWETRKASQSQAIDLGAFGSLPACTELKQERDFKFFTPRVGLQYDLTNDQMAYATVSQGYKSGGATASACGESFDPEFITAYEGGYKFSSANRRTTLNAAVFFYDYTDLQVAQIDGTATLIRNAPAAEIAGAEFEFTGRITDDLHFDGALTLLNAEYKDYNDTDALGGPLNEDLSGNKLSRSPAWTVNFGVEQSWAIGGVGLRLRGEVFHSDKYYFRAFNRPDDLQEAYTLANVYLTADFERFGITGRLWVKNLTDERYLGMLTSTSVQSAYIGNYAPPRTFGAEIGVKF